MLTSESALLFLVLLYFKVRIMTMSALRSISREIGTVTHITLWIMTVGAPITMWRYLRLIMRFLLPERLWQLLIIKVPKWKHWRISFLTIPSGTGFTTDLFSIKHGLKDAAKARIVWREGISSLLGTVIRN